MERIRWGIMGPGFIAHQFATGLKALPEAALVGVASRAPDRARAFAAEFGIPKAYGSYEELAASAEVDAVYVATPHPTHLEYARMALRAGKAVLCEKPISLNASEAEAMAACARENGRFLMEAVWSRFLPAYRVAQGWLRSKAIGEVLMVKADFAYKEPWPDSDRHVNLELGGGALLDIGVYALDLASDAYRREPSSVASQMYRGHTGADLLTTMALQYGPGKMALLGCGTVANIPHDAYIYGTEGSIHIPDFWHAKSATLRVEGKAEEIFSSPYESTGYQYEARAVMDCIREGKTECPTMPLDESLATMRVMDRIRAEHGLRYPTEEKA